jgi:hypothetical protein
VTLGLTNNSTPEQVAQAIIGESKRRGHSRDESIAEVSTGRQESGLQMVKHPTADWWGYYQQDASYLNRRGPNGNVLGFLDRLDAKRASPGASPDPFKNIFRLQQRPSDPTAETAYQRGRKAYYDEIRRHIDWATEQYDRHTGGTVATPSTHIGITSWFTTSSICGWLRMRRLTVLGLAGLRRRWTRCSRRRRMVATGCRSTTVRMLSWRGWT